MARSLKIVYEQWETSRREIVLINRPEPGPASHWDTTEKIARIVFSRDHPRRPRCRGLAHSGKPSETDNQSRLCSARRIGSEEVRPETGKCIVTELGGRSLDRQFPCPFERRARSSVKIWEDDPPCKLNGSPSSGQIRIGCRPRRQTWGGLRTRRGATGRFGIRPNTIQLSMNGSTQNYAAFSPDARYIATGDETGHARIWEITTGRQLRVRQVDESI